MGNKVGGNGFGGEVAAFGGDATLEIRTMLRTPGVRSVIAEVVAAECGTSPRRVRGDSTAWRAYRTSFGYLAESLQAWKRIAQADEAIPDLRAFAFVAANRACWNVMDGDDARRARLRSQLRCIFSLTAGYALWKAAPGGASRLPQWMVGRNEHRLDNRSAAPRSIVAGVARVAVGSKDGAAFDVVRQAALRIVDLSRAPVIVEDLVAVLSADGVLAAEGAPVGRVTGRRAGPQTGLRVVRRGSRDGNVTLSARTPRDSWNRPRP